MNPTHGRQDKSVSPFGRFALVGQGVTACRRKGGGAAFPEKPTKSTRIAPPTGFSGSAILVRSINWPWRAASGASKPKGRRYGPPRQSPSPRSCRLAIVTCCAPSPKRRPARHDELARLTGKAKPNLSRTPRTMDGYSRVPPRTRRAGPHHAQGNARARGTGPAAYPLAESKLSHDRLEAERTGPPPARQG